VVAEGPAGTAAAGPPRNVARWALAAACTGTFILLMNVTIVIVALPELARDLGASAAAARWVVAGYALTLAALLLGAGSFADRLGHRRVFLAGLVLFLLASSLCGGAWSPAVMLGGRVIQGAAAAMLFSTSLALIAGAFPGPRRASALGAWAATVGLSTTLGPLLGGLLVDGLSWRWVFFINLPTAGAAAAIVLLRVPELTERVRAPVDWRGQGLAAGGLASVVYALGAAGSGGWLRAAVLIPLAAGLTLLAVFALVELRQRHPMLDPRLLRRPGLSGAALAGFTLHCSLFALFVFIAVWLQGVRGYSAIITGLVFVPPAAMSVMLGPFDGRLARRASPALRVGVGLGLVSFGLFLISAVEPGSSPAVLLPGLVLAGAGVGIANPAIAGAALGALEPARSGLASGLNVTCRQLGTAVGVAALGSLLELRALARVDDARFAEDARRAAEAAAQGSVARGRALAPAEVREAVVDAGRAAYTAGLSDVLLVATCIAAAGALLAAFALRREGPSEPEGEPVVNAAA
jgi:EmrB/QacA subfamily drug resistance transporter